MKKLVRYCAEQSEPNCVACLEVPYVHAMMDEHRDKDSLNHRVSSGVPAISICLTDPLSLVHCM